MKSIPYLSHKQKRIWKCGSWFLHLKVREMAVLLTSLYTIMHNDKMKTIRIQTSVSELITQDVFIFEHSYVLLLQSELWSGAFIVSIQRLRREEKRSPEVHRHN